MRPLYHRRLGSMCKARIRLSIAASLQVLAASGILAYGMALAGTPAAPPPAPGVRTPLTALPSGPSTQVPATGPQIAGKTIYAPQQLVAGTLNSYKVATNANGTVTTGTLTQGNAVGILQWNSFDIGANATLNIVQPSTTAVLLNRVSGGWSSPGAMTVIEGMLNANGQVYILNPNGIVFGKTSQVNVNSLVASTVNISNDRFLTGLTAPNKIPVFSATSAAGDLLVEGVQDPTTGVITQAQISSASGGRILLVAPNVTNNGKITAPDGQVILAAGNAVYLSNPDSASMRGLWVEVNNNDQTLPAVLRGTKSSATNGEQGKINVGHGNASIVGYAVNQNGIVTANTSVSLNGSIWLHARDGATQDSPLGHASENTGGQLELGAKSLTQILPDADTTATSAASTPFNSSKIDLSGNTIRLDAESQVAAPGGNVAITALKGSSFVAGDGSRVYMDAKALIDVSGTTDTQLSMDSNAIKVFLGSNELQDSPLLRNDPALHGQTISVDMRKGTPLLSSSSWQSYLDSASLTVGQRSAAGGNVTIKSGGDVILQTGSQINVSGGQVNYLSGNVPTSQVTYAGRAYDVGSATTDKPYDGVIAATAGPRNFEAGYAQGFSAGNLNIDTSAALLRGTLLGTASPGPLQRNAGSAAYPHGGSLVIGSAQIAPGATVLDLLKVAAFDYGGAVDIGGTSTLNIKAPAFGDSLNPALRSTLELNPTQLALEGFSSLNVFTTSGIKVSAPIQLAAGGAVTLYGQDPVNINAGITAAGGSISAASVTSLSVADNVRLNVSGAWTNDRASTLPLLDSVGRPLSSIVTQGGRIALGAPSVSIGNGDVFNVSGGAWLNAQGSLSSGNGGSIKLDSDTDPTLSLFALGDGVNFMGYGVNKGGTLEMTARGFILGAAAADKLDLSLDSAWLQQGGFSKYDLRAAGNLIVADGAMLAPRMDTLLQNRNYALAPSGEMNSAFGVSTLPLAGAFGSRGASSLSLTTLNPLLAAGFGVLDVQFGAAILTDPGATVSLQGATQLTVDGRISAPGGIIKLSELNGGSSSVWLGSPSALDVSGTAARLWQDGNGLSHGTVLDGGSILIGNFDSSGAMNGGTPNVVINPGASLLANGAAAPMTLGNGVGIRTQTVASAGGTVTVDAASSLLFAGSLSAAGGNSSAAGGTLNLVLDNAGAVGSHDFVIGNGKSISGGKAKNPGDPIAGFCGGQACILAATINNAGLDWVNVKSQGTVIFDTSTGDLSLGSRSGLTINTPTIVASNQSLSNTVTLTSPYVEIGNTDWHYQNSTSVLPASSGKATLKVETGTLDLAGQSSLVNFGDAQFDVSGDVRLVGQVAVDLIQPPPSPPLPLHAMGSLSIAGTMEFASAQVYPTTLSEFTLAANGSGSSITFSGNGNVPVTPLSAAGTLTVIANDIVQNGVVRAPLGNITMQAVDTLSYGPGSLTSVAGSATVPLGFVQNGLDWFYDFGNGHTVNLSNPTASNYLSLPDKTIFSNAANVNLQKGAQLDMSGGGNLYAYEFTPGPGGSRDVLASAAGIATAFAILPGYSGSVAPQDFQNAQGASLRPGDQVYLSGIAGLPAGYYTLLPAHYALLNGAFAISLLSGTTDRSAANNYQKTDGSWVVAGYRSYAGGGADNRWNGFLVTPSSLVRQESEFTDYSGSTFLAASGVALPADGGHVAFDVSKSLQLNGSVNLAAAAGGKNGIADISAPEIAIVSDRSQVLPAGSAPGALELAAGDLVALGADSLLVGGIRTASSGGDRLTVGANNVIVDNDTAHPLTGPEIILAATDTVKLDSSSSVVAQGSLGRTPQTLLLSNKAAPAQGADGALIRVSSGAAVNLQRNYVATDGTISTPAGLTGTADIEAGATLSAGGSVLVDATNTTLMASPLALGKGAALGLGSSRISFGSSAPLNVSGLRFDDAALAAMGNLSSIAFTSYSTIDLYGLVSLGSASTQNLSLNAAGMQAYGAATNPDLRQASFTGQTIKLGGVGSFVLATPAPPTSAGSIAFNAKDIEIGSGSLAVKGFATTTLNASNGLLATGNGGAFSADSALNLTAAQIGVANGSSASFAAGGQLSLSKPAGEFAGSSTTQFGGQLAFSGDNIVANANVIASAGQIRMNANNGISIAGGTISAAGGAEVFGSTTAYAPGGGIVLDGGAGNVAVAAAATLDVSAVGADAGSISVKAANGSNGVAGLNGTLKGSSVAGVDGTQYAQGSFSLDVDKLDPAMSFGAVNAKLDAGGFTQSRNFRVRNDNVALNTGEKITAQQVTISADNGNIDIAGTVDASGAAGGSIQLYAAEASAGSHSGNVVVHSGARLLANSIADPSLATNAAGSVGDGGSINIGTATADGSQPSVNSGDASITLASGAALDVSGVGAGQGGTVLLRAPRLSGSKDVAIASLDASTIKGSRATAIEAFQVYSAGTISADANSATNLQVADPTTGAPAGTLYQDAKSFIADNGSAIASRLNLGSIALLPGMEVRSAGDLSVSVNEDDSVLAMNRGWNLDAWRFNGQPGVLTLRAAGNLLINGSISDGFTKSAKAAMPDWAIDATASGATSWSYRLVGGADQSAANPVARTASTSSGDVVLSFARTSDASGNDSTGTDHPVALVRTGTGFITVAAGRDVVLDTLDLSTGTKLVTDNRDPASGIWTAPDPIINPYSSDTLIGAAIYTAGTATALPVGFTAPKNNSNSAYGSTAPTSAAFTNHGGSIDISAHGNVLGPITNQLVDNWLFRQGAVNVDGSFATQGGLPQNTAWWSRFDYFDQGVATFGGGDIRVTAQTGNVSNLSASVATNAYMPGTTSVGGTLIQQGGGDLTVQAGGDIRGGVYYVQEGSAALRAGKSISSGDLYPGGGSTAMAPILAVGNANFLVTAGTDLTIGGTFNPMLTPQSSNNTGIPVTSAGVAKVPNQFGNFSTYGPNSAVHLTSVSGGITLASDSNAMISASGLDSLATNIGDSATPFQNYTIFYGLQPGTLTAAALAGNITVQGDGFSLWPNATGQLELLAQGSIRAPAAAVMLDANPATLPTVLSPTSPLALDASLSSTLAGFVNGASYHTASGLHANDPQPARIIALSGDINFSNDGNAFPLVLPKQAEISAGRDILDLGFYIQQLNPTDVTTVSAGRDIIDTTLTSHSNATSHWVSGPGRVDFTAGRNFDLGNGGGVVTRGNLDNPYLPAQGAAIDVVAGAQPDYAGFLQKYGSASVLTPGDQTALVNYVRQQNPALATDKTATPAAALDYFNTLPQAERLPFLTALLHSQSRPAMDALFYQQIRTVSGATGGGSLSLAGFDAVIASLFPTGSVSGGNVNVFGSELKTQRGGAITIYAPGGSVFAGLASVPAYLKNKPASDLGIFTIGGGAIQALVNREFLVNQGRLFTIGGGDITLASQYGDIDAGKGAKTAVSAPPPLLTTDPMGNTQVDISSSISGSGIATLKTDPSQSDGNIYPIAPRGIFNAGDAGVRSTGSVNIVAEVVLNASNITASSGVSGAPAATAAAPATPAAPASATSTKNDNTANAAAPDPNAATNLSVELLGYGGTDGQQNVTQDSQNSPPVETDDERKKKKSQ